MQSRSTEVQSISSRLYIGRVEERQEKESETLNPASSTAWCSGIGSLTSLDTPEFHASSDVKEPISLYQTVVQLREHQRTLLSPLHQNLESRQACHGLRQWSRRRWDSRRIHSPFGGSKAPFELLPGILNRCEKADEELLPGILNRCEKADEESRIIKDRLGPIGCFRRKPSGGFKHSSGHYRDRPIRAEADKRLKSRVRQLATRPRGFGDRFVLNELGYGLKAYANPPWNMISGIPGLGPSQATGGNHCVGRPGLENSNMALPATAVTLLIQEPSWFIKQMVWSSQLPTHMHANQLPKHTEAPLNWPYLRAKFSGAQRISPQASRLLLASWREKSGKTYDSLFRKWAGWCTERDRWSPFWRCHKRGKFPRRSFPPRISAQIPLLKQIGNLLCTWACRWTTTSVEPIQARTQWCRDCWKMCSMRDRHNLATQLHRISQWLQIILPESLADNQDLTVADH